MVNSTAVLSSEEMNGSNGHQHAPRRRQQEPTPENRRIPSCSVGSIRPFKFTGVLFTCLLCRAGCENCVAWRLSIEGECAAPQTVEPVLPAIVADKIPHSRYLSKDFGTSKSASSSSWLAADREKITVVAERGNDESSCMDETCHDVDQRQQPMAGHLMVDMKNVDAAFLNSERRLADAMLQVINETNLTLLSYHCHGLVPSGVSCVGVLQQNYVSFHTWPENGVITLDLCVGGVSSLLSAVSIIERVFGVPQTPGDKHEMRWAHKVRGFQNGDDDKSENDLSWYFIGDIGSVTKEQVSSRMPCM